MRHNNKQKDDEMLLAWAGRVLRNAQDAEMYGTVTISLKQGEIVRIDKNESYIPPRAGASINQTGG